ncbi:MAG: carboxylesterase family protein, partial [Candidatus Thiodiazotropha sp.]
MSVHITVAWTIFGLAITGTATNAPSVETRLGKIVGTTKEVDVFGKKMTVDKYHGIPYAEPPVGDLRFKKPVPKESLPSPFQATKHGSICYQINLFPGLDNLTRSEDCLFLNIYAPSKRKEPLAVMVWIHGGGFMCGASDLSISDTLASYGDVIIVTVNYRLTVWGFLSTGDANAPGNIGFWDQHLAIKWVHDNIQAFGGDPNRVTIFGESAGGMSVTYQSLYSGNKDLFQRVIAQSGTLWATAAKDTMKDAKRLGELVG